MKAPRVTVGFSWHLCPFCRYMILLKLVWFRRASGWEREWRGLMIVTLFRQMGSGDRRKCNLRFPWNRAELWLSPAPCLPQTPPASLGWFTVGRNFSIVSAWKCSCHRDACLKVPSRAKPLISNRQPAKGSGDYLIRTFLARWLSRWFYFLCDLSLDSCSVIFR